jgi:hypothetical protein
LRTKTEKFLLNFSPKFFKNLNICPSITDPVGMKKYLFVFSHESLRGSDDFLDLFCHRGMDLNPKPRIRSQVRIS